MSSFLSDEDAKNFHTILNFYQKIISNPQQYLDSKKVLFSVPVIPIKILNSLLNQALKVFSAEPVLLRLSSPIVVVGDLHGHIIDLFRIFNRLKTPPSTTYLFLGDLVDRGEFSAETICLLLLFKVLYPDKIYIIRGNHEFSELWANNGFGTELQRLYESIPLNALFSKVFAMIPFAALIDANVFCVHGGIGPNVTDLKSIETIERPVFKFAPALVPELVWSDPNDMSCAFMPSRRGYGHVYGKSAVEAFLSENNLKVIIRAHQCILGGVEPCFDGKVVTVFSASNYCDETGNKSGVLQIFPNGSMEPVFFQPNKNYILRINTVFLQSTSPDEFILENIRKEQPLNMNGSPPLRRKSLMPKTCSFPSVPISTHKSPRVLSRGSRQSLAPNCVIKKPKPSSASIMNQLENPKSFPVKMTVIDHL